MSTTTPMPFLPEATLFLSQSHQVWFHLPYDQTHTHWGQLEQDR